jgi:NUBPL iron-transfer P-loop NTPase
LTCGAEPTDRGFEISNRLKSTDWGDLDILLLDLPPGTGDVQLAVLQELQLTGAVAVTTPSRLAVADTLKGIEMFTSLGVPTMAVVENMSYFEDETGKRHYPFGIGISDPSINGNNNKNNQQSRFENVIKLPISMATNDANETSNPLTLFRPDDGATNELAAYNLLGNIVCQQLLNNDYGNDVCGKQVVHFADDNHQFELASVTLSLDNNKELSVEQKKFVIRFFSETSAKEVQVLPLIFRASDPRTGDLIQESPFLIDVENKTRASAQDPVPMVETTKLGSKKSPSIVPTSVSRRGRYGFQVVWQDGATIIYSNLCIARCAGGKMDEASSI